MNSILGSVRNKRGRKQKDGGRIYIIRFYSNLGDTEIRVKEKIDTDASFHSEDQIEIITDDSDMVTIQNHTLRTSITGQRIN